MNDFIEIEKEYKDNYKDFVYFYFRVLGVKNGKLYEFHNIKEIIEQEITFRKLIRVGRCIYQLSFGEEDRYFSCDDPNLIKEFKRYSKCYNYFIDEVKYMMDRKTYDIYLDILKAFEQRYLDYIKLLIIRLAEDNVEDDIYAFERSLDYINSLSEEELEQSYMIYEMKYGE